MKVVFLKNVFIGARRYEAGEDADVDAALGKQLVDASIAAEFPTVKAEAPQAAPRAAKPARRAASKAVKA